LTSSQLEVALHRPSPQSSVERTEQQLKMFHRAIGIFLVVTALGCAQRGAADRSVVTAPKLACNLRGLSSVERVESQQLLRTLGTAVAGIEELPNGYALRLDPAKLPPTGLFRWVDLERRCCPFFHFAIEISPGSDAVSLRLTGGAEVKEFIRSKLQT
jgi:hypothetical protein